MTPDRMSRIYEKLADARAKGAVEGTTVDIMVLTIGELEELLDIAKHHDSRTKELLGSSTRYEQLWRDAKSALQAAVMLGEKATGALITMNNVVDHQTNRLAEPVTFDDGTVVAMQVHPLTCGNDSNHTPLYPYWRGDGKVVLRCRDCDYEQDNAGPFG